MEKSDLLYLVRNFLYKESVELKNILMADYKEMLFLASNFSEIANKNSWKPKLFEKIANTDIYNKTEDIVNNALKNLKDKENIVAFEEERIRLMKSFQIITRFLRRGNTALSEYLDSLPPRISPVVRHNRKIEYSDVCIVENIYRAYFNRMHSIFKDTWGIEIREKGKKNRPIIFIDYATANKFDYNFDGRVGKLLGSMGNEDSLYIQDLRLPYWAVKKLNYSNLLAHEIAHEFIDKFITNRIDSIEKRESIEKGNVEVLKRKIKILSESVELVFKNIYLEDPKFRKVFLEPSYPITTEPLWVIYVKEILVDLFALLTAGPSYYFSLFLILLPSEPLSPFFFSGAPPVFARLLILQNLLNTVFKVTHKLESDKEDYWYKMFNSLNLYLEQLMLNQNYNNTIDRGLFEIKINICQKMGRLVSDEILYNFWDIINKYFWDYTDYIDREKRYSITDLLKIGIHEKSDFLNPNFNEYPAKFFNPIINGSMKSIKDIIEKFGALMTPEILWDIHTKKYSSEKAEGADTDTIDKNHSIKEAERDRFTVLPIARLLSFKNRSFYFDDGKSTDDKKDLRVKEIYEWLFIKINWPKVKELLKIEGENENIFDRVKILIKDDFDKNKKDEYNKDDKRELKIYTLLGEYDYLFSLKGASTRMGFQSWPPLWKTSEGKASGLYQFRRYICERIYPEINNQRRDNEFLTIFLKLKNPERLTYKKLGKIIDLIEKRIGQEKLEIYLSNAWNDLFLKILTGKNIDKIITSLNEAFEQEKIEIIERQSFISINSVKDIDKYIKLRNGAITIIQSKSIKFLNKWAPAKTITDPSKAHLRTCLGIWDYIIQWKEGVSLKTLLKDLSNIIVSDLGRKNPNKNKQKGPSIINISTFPFVKQEK